jgi:hypothetical protein
MENSTCNLRLQEALHVINKIEPEINIQVKHFNTVFNSHHYKHLSFLLTKLN